MFNQDSTKPTGRFTDIYAYNSLGEMVAYYTALGPQLRNREPAIAPGTLHQTDRDVGVEATYTFTYTTIN